MIDIDSPDFADVNWQGYFALLTRLHHRFQTPLRCASWQELRSRSTSYAAKEKAFSEAVLYDNDQPLAWITFWLRNKGTPNQEAWLAFDCDHPEVPRNVDKLISEFTLSRMSTRRLESVFCTTYDPRLTVLARLWGAVQLGHINDYILHRYRANTERMKDWLRTIPKRNLDLSLRFYAETPEEHASAFAQLFNQCLGDMPEEQDRGIPFHIEVEDMLKQVLWRRQNRYPAYKYLLFNTLHELVGFTVSEFNLSDPSQIHQAMTGVREDYRRHGLAKWLKAAMFFKLGKDFPSNKTIVTEMRAVNEPIQRVNAQMGFNLRRSGYEFRIERDRLARYVAGRSDSP